MQLFVTSLTLSFAVGLTAMAFSAALQQNLASDPVNDADLSKLEFRIAQDKPGQGLVEATILDSDEKVYLREEAGVTSDDIAYAFIVSYGEVQVEFTATGAKKIAELTKANIGKRLAVIVDGRVISAPTIRATVSDKAVISGNFTIGEARKIVRGIVTPPFHTYLVLIKPDWSQVDDAERIRVELQKAMEDAAVPQPMLEGLPASGTSILFPTEMVSLYTPEHYVDLLAWLKQRDLLVSIERFPPAEATPISTARGTKQPRPPMYTTSIGKPPEFLRLPELPVQSAQDHGSAKSEDVAKPFVVQRVELTWHVHERPLGFTGSEKELGLMRQIAIQEEKRGREPSVARVLDESEVRCQVPGHHVTVMQAFPVKTETQFRKAALRLGFLPLIVTVPVKPATPKSIGKPIVRPPDIVETVTAHYGKQHTFWPAKPNNEVVAASSLKHDQPKKPDPTSAGRTISTVEFRLTFADAGSVESTLKQLFHDELTIVADRRTNSLIARGNAAVIDEVSKLIKKIDVAEQSADAPEMQRLETDRSKPLVPQSIDIDRLRSEYNASEKAAAETAANLRASARGPAEDRVEKLKRQLRGQVALSFRIRQQLHQAELESIKQKLQDAFDTIRQRDAIKDQIIDRRVIDLMNPNLEWDKPVKPNNGTEVMQDESLVRDPDVVERFSDVFNSSKKKAAEAQISAICTMVEIYRLDTNEVLNSLEDLRRDPGNVNGWRGPYAAKEIPPDPWGNPYRAEQLDSRRVKFSSDGPDGKPGTEDDIVKLVGGDG
jgi:hypothetical protein